MYYSVHNEKPISPFGELGKKRPKLDIQIQRHGCRPTPHFTFEAKRLRDDRLQDVRKTMTAYLGDEGVKRFVTNRYASESVEAAMLGCVQARDASIGLIRLTLLSSMTFHRAAWTTRWFQV